MVAAYQIEGELIGVEDFPPLRRAATDIRATEATFFGCVENERLIAAAEVEEAKDGGPHIGGFVVHPSEFRRGIGSKLLNHVLQSLADSRTTVSTAALNRPALSLYEKHGFTVVRQWNIGSIEMVTLEYTALAADPAGCSATDRE